jgi:1-acyl-sn-glycerol-3-phosphate acyltransferase
LWHREAQQTSTLASGLSGQKRPLPTRNATLAPRETPLFRLTYRLVRLILRLYFRFAIEGAAQLPPGGALVVANHPSALDPLILAAALPRRGVFIAAAEFLHLPAVGWAMRTYGVIPVWRGQTDLSAIKDAIAALEAGTLVVIFPEGRVSPAGGAAKAGAGLLAARTGAAIVPAALVGTGRALPLGAVFPRPRRVGVIFGAPRPAPSDRAAAEEVVAEALAWAQQTEAGA